MATNRDSFSWLIGEYILETADVLCHQELFERVVGEHLDAKIVNFIEISPIHKIWVQQLFQDVSAQFWWNFLSFILVLSRDLSSFQTISWGSCPSAKFFCSLFLFLMEFSCFFVPFVQKWNYETLHKQICLA